MAERTRRVGAVLVAGCALLVGCAQIPTAGPVVAGDLVQQPERPPYVPVVVPPPQAGADQEGIVDGFIKAMTSYDPGYATAKMFLTPDAAAAWDPSAAITVHAGVAPSIDVIDEGHARITFPVAGTVGPDGSFLAAEPGRTEEIVFEMVQVDGEWRIANPPEGVVMSEFNFSREFEAHNLYFFDPSYSVLVPDPVYIPKNGQPTTFLAQALLRGPSGWLTPAVRTAFPEGTELSVRGVPVDQGTALVELTAQASQAPPDRRELMAAQLAWTLSEIPEVSGVDVTSDGIPLYGDATARPIGGFAEFDPDVLPADAPLMALEDTGVVEVQGDDTVPVVGPFGSMPGLREIAVNVGGNRAVAVDPSGTQLLVATFGENDVVETLATGTDLESPAWDRTGLVWAIDQTGNDSNLLVVRPDGERVDVDAPGLEGRRIDRLAVSLDGTRIVVVVNGLAHVGLIVRSADGSGGIQVESLRRIGPDVATLDVAWDSPASVALLLRSTDEAPEPYVVGLSGAINAQRGKVPGAASLAGAPGQPLVVTTTDGVLMSQQSAAQWGEIATGRAATYGG